MARTREHKDYLTKLRYAFSPRFSLNLSIKHTETPNKLLVKLLGQGKQPYLVVCGMYEYWKWVALLKTRKVILLIATNVFNKKRSRSSLYS